MGEGKGEGLPELDVKIRYMDIPVFPDSRPIMLEDKAAFDLALSVRPTPASEYTFSNFFIWRMLDRSEVTLINGNICCLAYAPDGQQYFMMPLGVNDLEDTIRICLSRTKAVIRTDEAFASRARMVIPELVISEDTDNADYLYLAKDLAELKGKRYDAKRNHINSFLKTNTFTYMKMAVEHVEECIKLNDKWCAEKTKESELFPNVECEGKVVREALENLGPLGLIGGVIIVNGSIKAFSLGEKPGTDTAVIHIEKADPEIRGMSQLINREFARNAWADTTYINREQDMGHPGLKKAKLSYHPCAFVKKYSLSFK